MKFKRRKPGWGEQRDKANRAQQLLGKAVGKRRQYIGAQRIAHENDFVFVPHSKIVTQDACQVGSPTLGRARRPKVLKRIDSDYGNTVTGERVPQVPINASPATIARKDNCER
jgi:hypothetical protein